MKGFSINKREVMKKAWSIFKGRFCPCKTFGECLSRAWEVVKENMIDRENAAKNEWDYSQYAGFGQSDLDGFFRFSYDINRGVYE